MVYFFQLTLSDVYLHYICTMLSLLRSLRHVVTKNQSSGITQSFASASYLFGKVEAYTFRLQISG